MLRDTANESRYRLVFAMTRNPETHCDRMEESVTLLFRLAKAIAKHRDYDVTDGPYLGGFRGNEVGRNSPRTDRRALRDSGKHLTPRRRRRPLEGE